MAVKVRLTRKFAQVLNGIDLSRIKPGEEVELAARDAQLLVAEGWASPVDTADDRPARRPRSAARRRKRTAER